MADETTAAPTESAYRRARPEGPEAVRAALLDVAMAQLEADGAHALSLRRIARTAGCSTMVLYTAFGGKPELLEALYREGFRRLGAAAAAPLEGADPVATDPRTTLRVQLERYRAFAHAHAHLYELMFARTADFEPSPEARAGGWTSIAPLVATVRTCIDRGLARAGDPEAIAAQLWAAAHGVVSLELAGNLPPDDGLDESIYRSLAERLVGLAD